MNGQFKMYDSYKASGVERIGKIPHYWKASRIKDWCRIVNGSTPKSGVDAYWDGEIAWVTPSDLSNLDSPYVESGERSISAAGYKSCGTQIVPAGSVILSSRAPIGTVAIAEKGMCTNQGCKSLVVGKNLNSKYLYYILAVSSTPLNTLGRGATFLELSSDELGRFRIACPELPEQTQIAKFLDYETAKIDALIEKQQQLIALLKEKRQAVISHAVTKGLNPDVPMRDSGVAWLGEVPAHWGVIPFRHALQVANGQVDPRILPYSAMSLVAPNHIESGTGKLLALESAKEQGAISGKYEVCKGDVIYSKIRPALRKVTVAPEDCLCSADMYALRPARSGNPTFFCWLLLSEYFSDIVVLESMRVAMPKVNRETLAQIPLPMPNPAEQQEIVDHLAAQATRLDTLVDKATNAIKLLQERRTALISAAVTGKIDVRGWQPPA